MSRFSCSEITTARLSYTVPEGFPQQVTRIFVMAAIPTNGLSDNFSAKQMPTSRTRDQSHVTARCAIVRGVWRGMVDLSTPALRHPCHQPHQPGSLGASSTGRCHSPCAPRLPRAHSLRGPARPAKTTWKWSLSSGYAALRWTGSLPWCTLYSRRETRHEIIFCSKSLVRDREPRSTKTSHPVGLFIQLLQVQLPPLHVTTCSPSLYYSHSPAYLPQLPLQ